MQLSSFTSEDCAINSTDGVAILIFLLGKSMVNEPHDRLSGPGGGHFNFICLGVCGHRIGKLTHPQTKPGQKTDPFSDYLQ